MEAKKFRYRKALPVWEKGCSNEKNVTLSFHTTIEGNEAVTLYASAASSFTAFLGGKLIAHGPARTAHGFFRVDEIDLTPHLTIGKNLLVVRVTGYNVDSFAYLDQRPFFCAELVRGETVLAATAPENGGFEVHRMTEKVKKVQRYSYQRPFIEVYRLAPGAFGYENGDTDIPEVALEKTEDRVFLTRTAPYGDYDECFPVTAINGGSVAYSEKEAYHSNRAITRVSETDDQFECDPGPKAPGTSREKKFYIKGFKAENLEIASYKEVGMMDFTQEGAPSADTKVQKIGGDRYVDFDMGANETGLIAFDLDVHESSHVYVLFDEHLQDGKLNPFRIGSSNILSCDAKPGSYRIVSAEPYTFRFLRFVAKGGAVTVQNPRIIKVEYPASKITAVCKTDDKDLRKIYDAAIRTFSANTVDVYMDCPSRERAGWLCDSFFTSRVEYVLTGKTAVERDFLEAFILRDSFPDIPKGMLPMCYPSDHNAGTYIPNWAMWYVLELREYLDRSGDRELIDRAKNTVYALYDWFRPFENEDGLLEKLDGWVFVEWSRANDLVQDVSFASNMLYASFLDVIDALYGAPAEHEKAEKIRNYIRENTMLNGYFCDNAVRQDGKLVLSGECTEACQYYAFFCGVATPETYPELWETLVRDFGFDRRVTKKHPEIHFANAFIGNYLRLDLLCRYGYRESLENNIRDYFTYMAESTGTLWEYEQDKKSCNHGFASHVLYWMEKLGLVQHG